MGPLHSTLRLAGRPVVFEDARLGVVVDTLLDRPLSRLVGFEIECRDGAHRFLPFPACDVLDDRVAVESALVLLDRDLDFYRLGGSAFSDLQGDPVGVHGNEMGPLVDFRFTAEGDVRKVVAATPQREIELEPGPGLVVGNHFLRPAV
jgi:hypothetical protein